MRAADKQREDIYITIKEREAMFHREEIKITFPCGPLSHFCRQGILTLEFQLHLASQIAGEFSLGFPVRFSPHV